MKKSLFFLASLPLLASCASDELVDTSVPSLNGNGAATISFTTNQKNITRATPLQDADHYNFGVFAYKSTDLVNPVMPNYLVGYFDDAKAYQETGTTVGDQGGLVDGQSYWMYEGMGYNEYNGTYAGAALTDAFKSNNANQYLKYWDNAAATTAFYAYAPYINGANTVTYVDGTAQSATGGDTYVMCFPDGTIEAGMDNPALSEYMYAYNKVPKSEYGHDVALQFNRLNAKVNIKFWEDVPGYKVRILDLGGNKNYEGVQAAASIKDNTSGDFGYKAGKFYKKNGVKISFAGATPAMKQFVGTAQTNSEPLVFKAPTVAQIGENRYTASASASTYYAIPKGQNENLLAGTSTDFSNTGAAEDEDFGKTGFTFHVSYELTAEDTGEKIVVNNATVHVPYEYANWKPNTHYTYIFKITKNSNGTTSGDKDPGTDPSNPDTNIDPTDPEVPETQALYPIIFDNCTVVDWEENESEWVISKEQEVIYHDVQLFREAALATPVSSIVSGDIYVNVTDKDTYAGHTIDYSAITVAGPDATNVTYDNATHKITVAAGATAGVYTVTYTCPATYDQTTHPATWTEKFVVGNAYTITTHRDVIGTNSNKDEAKLNITGTKDNGPETLVSANLSIDYPANFSDADKAHVTISGTDVVVKKTAKPGVYKVVYKVDGAKVAEKTFTVVDYSLTLSHTTVFNTVGGTAVTGNQPADANHVYTCTTGTPASNAITVANDTPEGTYTVTYTVYGGQADETVYTKTFVVKNTYAVAINKTAVDKNTGTSNVGDTSSEIITVTLKKNGVATTTDLTASLEAVKADGSAVAAGSIYFQYDGGTAGLDTYYLRVTNNVPAGNYKIVYTGQTGVTAEAEFVVTE